MSVGDRLLCFTVGGERYAVPLLQVREVIAVPETTPVPYSPAHFVGIMNLRGQVISVVDLRLKLGMKKADRTVESAVIIVDFGSLLMGAVVDSVDSVLTVASDELKPPPELDARSGASGRISGVIHRDKKLILLLNISEVLDARDLELAKPSRANVTAA